MNETEMSIENIPEQEYVIKPIITVCKMFLQKLHYIQHNRLDKQTLEPNIPSSVSDLICNMEIMIEKYEEDECTNQNENT